MVQAKITGGEVIVSTVLNLTVTLLKKWKVIFDSSYWNQKVEVAASGSDYADDSHFAKERAPSAGNRP